MLLALIGYDLFFQLPTFVFLLWLRLFFALHLFCSCRENSWKPLYYALLSVIFFLGLYEIVWYYIAAYFFGYDLRIFEFASLGGWVLLCIKEVYPQKPRKFLWHFMGFT